MKFVLPFFGASIRTSVRKNTSFRFFSTQPPKHYLDAAEKEIKAFGENRFHTPDQDFRDLLTAEIAATKIEKKEPHEEFEKMKARIALANELHALSYGTNSDAHYLGLGSKVERAKERLTQLNKLFTIPNRDFSTSAPNNNHADSKHDLKQSREQEIERFRFVELLNSAVTNRLLNFHPLAKEMPETSLKPNVLKSSLDIIDQALRINPQLETPNLRNILNAVSCASCAKNPSEEKKHLTTAQDLISSHLAIQGGFVARLANEQSKEQTTALVK